MKFLIIGLGNIGSMYEKTRHNIGFRVVEKLAEKLGTTFVMDRLAESAMGKHKGKIITMLKPTTYMNLSGKAVKFHADKLKIDIENILVITDDISLPVGKIRLRMAGSDGGHNGLKSIQELLQTTQYPRLRIGVGNDFPKGKQADYVLSEFTEEEETLLVPVIEKCVDGILSFALEGIERTMNRLNA